MKNVLEISAIFILLALISCNKDDAAVKDLDGIWKMTSWVENGEEKEYLEYLELRWRFEACPYPDIGCEGLYYRRATYTQDSIEVSNEGFDYYVTDKGQSLKMEYEFGATENYTIEKLTKNKLRIVSIDGVYEYTFENQL